MIWPLLSLLFSSQFVILSSKLRSKLYSFSYMGQVPVHFFRLLWQSWNHESSYCKHPHYFIHIAMLSTVANHFILSKIFNIFQYIELYRVYRKSWDGWNAFSNKMFLKNCWKLKILSNSSLGLTNTLGLIFFSFPRNFFKQF